MCLLVVVVPLVHFLLISIFGRYFSRSDIFKITIYNYSFAIIAVSVIYYETVFCNTDISLDVFNWVILNDFTITWSLFFDNLTGTMLIIIIFISFLVHLYSFEYMLHDPHLNRFISYLSLFTFFMVVLVTSTNFLQLFL